MAEAWEPTPPEVKAHIPHRINGGPFTATTTPTEAQVIVLAGQVAADIVAFVDSPIVDAAHQNLAKYAAAVGTAANVERGIDPDSDEVEVLMAEYNRLVRNLRFAVTGADPDDDSVRLGEPTHTFPEWVTGVAPSDDRFNPLSSKGF